MTVVESQIILEFYQVWAQPLENSISECPIEQTQLDSGYRQNMSEKIQQSWQFYDNF